MAEWSFDEDYIVCKFYLEHVESWKENLDCLMSILREQDFIDRDKGSARMRVQNYESLHTGKGLSNAAQQSRDIYSAMIKRINRPEEHRLVRDCLNSVDISILIRTPSDMHSYIDNIGMPPGDSFHNVLMKFLKATTLTDPEIYGSSNMGRDTFWRIVNKKNNGINKKTAVQLCFGLKLSYEDSIILLGAAGFTLSKGEAFDHAVATYLQCKDYDVNDLNMTLSELNVPESLYLLPRNRRSPQSE